MYFNPPPNWPLPAGFTPTPEWQPEPDWPPAPAGWNFWVDGAATGLQPTSPYDGDTTHAPTLAPVGQPTAASVGPRRRRVLLVLGGVATVIAVGVVAVLVWRGFGSEKHAVSQLIASIAVPDSPVDSTIDPATRRLYVSQYEGRSIAVIDLDTRHVVGNLPVGEKPGRLSVLNSNHTLYVPLQSEASVAVVDPAANAVVKKIPVGESPGATAMNQANAQLYVANEGSKTVSVIETAFNTVSATIEIPGGPIDIAVDPSTRLVFTANSDGSIGIIDGTTNKVKSVANVGVNSSGALAVDSGAGVLYSADFANGTVSAMDTSTGTVVWTMNVGAHPRGLAFDPSVPALYVSLQDEQAIKVIDPATHAVTTQLALTARPTNLLLDPQTHELFSSMTLDGRIDVFGP